MKFQFQKIMFRKRPLTVNNLKVRKLNTYAILRGFSGKGTRDLFLRRHTSCLTNINNHIGQTYYYIACEYIIFPRNLINPITVLRKEDRNRISTANRGEGVVGVKRSIMVLESFKYGQKLVPKTVHYYVIFGGKDTKKSVSCWCYACYVIDLGKDKLIL